MKMVLSSWIPWAILSALFAALTGIFGKVGVEGMNSHFATFLRTAIVLPMLGGVVAISGAWQPVSSIPSRTVIFLALSGMATGISWLCYYRALQLGPVSGVAAVDKMSVILVALFAFSLLGERLEPRNWIGIGLVAFGLILVTMRDNRISPPV